MRIKDKLYCDYCGKFSKKLSKEQMKEILKYRREGTRISYVINCSCQNANKKR